MSARAFIWIRELGLSRSTSDAVRGAFGVAASLRRCTRCPPLSVLRFFWRGESRSRSPWRACSPKPGSGRSSGRRRSWPRGAAWFVLYLVTLMVRGWMAYGEPPAVVTRGAAALWGLVPARIGDTGPPRRRRCPARTGTPIRPPSNTTGQHHPTPARIDQVAPADPDPTGEAPTETDARSGQFPPVITLQPPLTGCDCGGPRPVRCVAGRSRSRFRGCGR